MFHPSRPTRPNCAPKVLPAPATINQEMSRMLQLEDWTALR